MSRTPRTFYKGAIHHIYFRGNQKATIFLSAEDYNFYINLMRKVSIEESIKILVYSVIPNHGHIVAQQETKNPASRFMHRLQRNFAQYWNDKYDKVGHVFQGRYKAVLCTNDAYLMELLRYIHLNAPSAGLVRTPEDYYWCSHLDYLRKRPQSFVDTELISSYFNNDINKLSQFVVSGLDNDNKHFIETARSIEIALKKESNHPIPVLSKIFETAKCHVFENMNIKLGMRNEKVIVDFVETAMEKGYSADDIAEYLGYNKATVFRKIQMQRFVPGTNRCI